MSAMASQINRLFRCISKKRSKLRVTGLCEENPPVTSGFSSQRSSNAENVSSWWHHANVILTVYALNCCGELGKSICIFNHFQTHQWHRKLEHKSLNSRTCSTNIVNMKAGDGLVTQGASGHGVDTVLQEYKGFLGRRFLSRCSNDFSLFLTFRGLILRDIASQMGTERVRK